MHRRLQRTVENAQTGGRHCDGCNAHERSAGAFVNPGLSNPGGELIFVTDEPRHPVEWEQHDDWTEYNDEWLPRFNDAQGGQLIEKLLEQVELSIDDVWITDSIKCPTQEDISRGIPVADTADCFDHCRAYLDAEIEAVNPSGIITLGMQATKRTLQVLGVGEDKIRQVQVSREYGHSGFKTTPPVVISLHWAQRTVAEHEWVPVVQEAIVDLVEPSSE